MQADYTKELDKIIDLLSRRDWPPAWALGTILGGVIGFLSSVLVPLVNEYRTRVKIELMLYREMTLNWSSLKLLRLRLMSMPPDQRIVASEAEGILHFEGYQYAKSKP